MKANDQDPAPWGKAAYGFSDWAAVRGRTLLPRRSEEGQNRASTLGIGGMSVQKGPAKGGYGCDVRLL